MMSCLVNDIHAQEMKNVTSAAAKMASTLPPAACGVSTSTSTAVTTSSAALNSAMAMQTNARNLAEPSTVRA